MIVSAQLAYFMLKKYRKKSYIRANTAAHLKAIKKWNMLHMLRWLYLNFIALQQF